MVNASTNYYRKNRKTNKIKHCCPHCSYETPNARIQLVNHINAKHVKEKDRPYQCDHCNRGFAQKAHLSSHSSVVHNIEQNILKVISISYIIEPTDIVPRSTKTKARRKYYMDHGVINTTDINNKKHEYLPGVYIKKHDIHYDAKKGFITLSKCNLHENTCDCGCITLPKYIISK
jgi:hypothetical protein